MNTPMISIRFASFASIIAVLAGCTGRSEAPAASPAPTSPSSSATAAAAPAGASDHPGPGEDVFTAQGSVPLSVNTTDLHGDAWFFTAQGRETAPVAVVPVAVHDGQVVAHYVHHHVGEAMITEVRLESPTLAPWWSIAWPDGKIHVGEPLARADAVRLHGILTVEEDGSVLPNVRIFGDIAGTILGRSDAQGRFECWVRKDDRQAHLLPFASNLVGHSRFVDATTYDGKDLHFTVERGMRIHFKVVDVAGKPLPGALVVWTGGASYQGKTDQHGDLVIGMVSRTAPHEPYVRLQGYVPVKPVGPIVAGDYVDHPLVITMDHTAVNQALAAQVKQAMAMGVAAQGSNDVKTVLDAALALAEANLNLQKAMVENVEHERDRQAGLEGIDITGLGVMLKQLDRQLHALNSPAGGTQPTSGSATTAP